MRWVSKGRVAFKDMQCIYFCMCFVKVAEIADQFCYHKVIRDQLWSNIYWEQVFFFIFWQVVDKFSRRRNSCWMLTNLNIYFLTKDKLGFTFKRVNFGFLWNNLSMPRVMIKITEWTGSSCQFFFVTNIFLFGFIFEIRGLCSDLCDLCLKKKKKKTFLELLSQNQVILLFYIKFVFCYATFLSIFM